MMPLKKKTKQYAEISYYTVYGMHGVIVYGPRGSSQSESVRVRNSQSEFVTVRYSTPPRILHIISHTLTISQPFQ